jgi:hypothetical protein
MGYMHIDNLYKDITILSFRQVYALEKIHGTSAHIKFVLNGNMPADFGGPKPTPCLSFFSGGEKHENFVKLFEQNDLLNKFIEKGLDRVVIYGEAYGGKQQGMKDTYGPELKFVAFDVLIEGAQRDGVWLDVPKAAKFCSEMGLDFVDYKLVDATVEALNIERDAESTQAIRNGMGGGKLREGIVIRPPFEVRLNNGKRLIMKHKRDEFKETKTPRAVDPDKLRVLSEANAIAEEWVVPVRMQHVLDKLQPPASNPEDTSRVIKAMIEDVQRESVGEVVWSPEVAKAIGKQTSLLFKKVISKI